VAQVEDAVHTPARLLRAAPSWTRSDWPSWTSACRSGCRLARRYKRAPEELADVAGRAGRPSWPQLDAAADLDGLRAAERKAQAAYMAEAKAALQGSVPRQRPCWPKPSPRPCRAWACRAAGSRWHWSFGASRMQSGLEDVQFLAAGHAGSTPRPVGKVASGGELSRMALAIAVTTSRLGTAADPDF